jgi:endonuclease/exonuclease/phosphatase family metal-dependent hydrolase
VSTLAASLALLFGLQLFRVLPVSLVWYLGSRLGFSPQQVGPMLLPLPLFMALIPFVQRVLGTRRTALLAALALAITRSTVQITAQPVAELALAASGLIFLSWWLLTWTQSTPAIRGADRASTLTLAWPLAVLVDTASRSLLLDYDLTWRRDGWALAITAVLVVLFAALAWADAGQRMRPATATINLPRPVAWLGLGAWLFLAYNVTQNAPQLMSLTGLSDIAAHWLVNTLTLLAALAGLVAARTLQIRRVGALTGLALITLVALSAASFVVELELGWIWYALIPFATWTALQLLFTATQTLSPSQPAPRLFAWRSSVALAAAWVILVGLHLLDYYPPWGNVTAGVLLAVIVLWLSRSGPAPQHRALARPWAIADVRVFVAPAIAVWLVITLWALLTRPPQASQPNAGAAPMRLMTYNIHHGTNAVSHMDLQAIADAIAAENPDVVALNEVSRGYISTGYVDTLWLISRRLGMPYVLGMSNREGRFGNALLSRYPITRWDNTPFQHLGTEVRGVLRATVDTPIGAVTFYATHLDHRPGPVSLRPEQAQEMLALWNDQPRSVLLGDMNARPAEPDLQAIYEAGFTDVLRATGQENAFTFWNPVPTPGRRIDYIFLTPDLTVTRAWIPQTRASDHLPVVAEIRPTP